MCCESPRVTQEPHSGIAVSGALAAGEGSAPRRCTIFRPLLSGIPILSQLCGLFLFSSSDALLNTQPPMVSVISGCLSANYVFCFSSPLRVPF